MILAFRRYLDSWVVRAFFLVMVAAFILWGVGDVARLVRTATWAAKVGGQTIEGYQLEDLYRREMAQATRDLPAGQEPSQETRTRVANEALQQLITQAALHEELQRLRIVAPDSAVRQSVFAMPIFRGQNGQFDRNTMLQQLRNNNLTEQRYLEMVRNDLEQRQLLDAVSAGAATPETLLRPLFQAQFEKRSADMVEFPFAAAPEPPAPTEADLQRWYDNHPDRYSSPEYRRIKAVVLSPQTLAKDIAITDADVQAAYDQHKDLFVKPPRRSVQVVSVADEAKAKALAETWRGGADWAAMQKAAQDAGGSAIALDDATERELPDPELGQTVFAATPDEVTGPKKGALSWQIAKVTKVTPGSEQTFDQVKDMIRSQILSAKAADLMYDRANKVDNVLGGGASLDEMPSDLGLVGVAGTLDAKGNTAEGTPAPVPGPDELRTALVKAAFDAQKGDPPRLVEVQTPSTGGSAYYALSVEDITPPAVKPFDAVKEQVTTDWTKDARRHAQEQAAARLLAAVKGGQSMADAAAVAGVTVRRTPLATRDAPAEGMPTDLVQPLFTLKPGEPTMVETPEGFIVAVPGEIVEADPKADPAGFSELRRSVARSVGGDLAAVFAKALRDRAEPRINQQVVNSVTGQTQ
ncbi:MAG TPA: peptidyl-prolyl cis-trans isomerase [Acetobacteraceae bacterium]|nr:peptidyl-prolyl cis-trans isomerase [Acetobacteraceae bacterium]